MLKEIFLLDLMAIYIVIATNHARSKTACQRVPAEENKEFLVELPNAVVNPGTVVVHFHDASR